MKLSLLRTQPCSLNDFMDYLLYVEHSAESLQFYLWYKDYVRRWRTLPSGQKYLSPEVRLEDRPFSRLNQDKDPSQKGKLGAARAKLISRRWEVDGVDYSVERKEEKEEEKGGDGLYRKSFVTASLGTTVTATDEEILAEVGLKWQPCMHTCSEYLGIIANNSYSYHSTVSRRMQQYRSTLYC